ncbi:LysR family transcriptional regulator [Burkholderia pseudomallei]|uniref:pca operon transcription factor PcaQ n=1 Tax=Burkholderia pseudomallei TaxID=28450 RepID=UPI000F05E5B8|nr:pca operon transcription factor PcaQ [Burkholderia pseudomallei]CAJ3317650.1 LysR family transcriptional regulator [Burkholderia pseudomallei]VCK34252.1 LysR family transcriptional regulator [Burkholderia pseudomallei]VCK36100.1 LysR family transcriptional regulator [Burkholderia pseudomallei]VCK37948.1 LysR family transcriptional regulator [Burkholderia pseudomallei]VCK38541.1 LysR family transcriptional regulator [Burkholderia pseudomallei]
MHNRIADGRVKFRHLQCFLAVAQFGSVQKAAHSLSITQPAVSKTIAELESILGVRLFERGRQGARPTREGQLFMPHASACVLALRQGVGLLAREGGGAAATLEIGMLPTVAASLAPAVLKTLAAEWPRAVVRITTVANAELLERLKAGAIECAIGRLSEPERMVGLSFEHLYNEPLVAVVRADHPLAASASPAAQLARYPVVLPPYGTMIRQAAEQLLSACGAPPLESFVEVLSVSVARALALENDAVWFVPRYAAEFDLAAGTLTRLALPVDGADEPVGLILRTDAQPSPVARALIDAVRAIARRRLAGAGTTSGRARGARGATGKGRGRRDA